MSEGEPPGAAAASLNGGGEEEAARQKRPRSAGSDSEGSRTMGGLSAKKVRVSVTSEPGPAGGRVNNGGQEQQDTFEKKSVLKQVDDLAAARSLEIEYRFVRPPGYLFKLGVKERPGDFSVQLVLSGRLEGPGQASRTFTGHGAQPYEAKREAAIQAKAFLTEDAGGRSPSCSGDSRSRGSGAGPATADTRPPGADTSAGQNGTNGRRAGPGSSEEEEDEGGWRGAGEGRAGAARWWAGESARLGLAGVSLQYTVSQISRCDDVLPL
jgi:hypothetical protein